MSNKIVKSVSFNVTNPLDALLLKAIKRRNFSGYVKKLIAADINAGDESPAKELKEAPQVAPASPTQSTTDKLAQLKRGGISAPKLF